MGETIPPTLEALPISPDGSVLEHELWEIVRADYHMMQASTLNKFTSSWIDSLLDHWSAILYDLERLPEEQFKQFIETIGRLASGRDELRLARFLFALEEVDPVRRLVMRNKAILRAKRILRQALSAWPPDVQTK